MASEPQSGIAAQRHDLEAAHSRQFGNAFHQTAGGSSPAKRWRRLDVGNNELGFAFPIGGKRRVAGFDEFEAVQRLIVRERGQSRKTLSVPAVCGQGGATECAPASVQTPYFSDVATDVKVVDKAVPTEVIATMITTEIKAAIRPYSIAVAPDTSPRKRAKIFFIKKLPPTKGDLHRWRPARHFIGSFSPISLNDTLSAGLFQGDG